MISKLRKRIIAINVISVCVIFFIATVFIFAFGFTRIRDERDARTQMFLNYDRNDPIAKEDMSQMLDTLVLVDYNVQTDSIVQICYGNNTAVKEELQDLPYKRIATAKEDVGMATQRTKYYKSAEGNVVRILLEDRFSTLNESRSYVWSSLVVVFFGTACYFVISWSLANVALKPVEESWNKQKQFVADASHELKTPLAVIMANTEIIASHKQQTVQSQMQWIQNTRAESERMAGLVSDLLFLAKNDDGATVQMDVVDFADCVNTIVLSHEALFYENGKQFTYDVTSNVQVMGNINQLKQLATILLDNANKYSVGSGNVLLTLAVVGKNAVLSVSNNCAPLSAEQLAHLFDRFYTVDPSRNKNIGGNGLGLAIAKMICETHNGHVEVGYGDGRITFTATLPLSKQKRENMLTY